MSRPMRLPRSRVTRWRARPGVRWVSQPLLLTLLALLAAGPAPAGAADQDALWRIVQDRCVPGQRGGDPKPCVLVGQVGSAAGGYAVLKDINGVAQYLLIPTGRVTGINDPSVLAPDAPNWWDPAWRARRFLNDSLGRTLPRDAVAVVANSVPALTQDQLHLHIDCINPGVRQALRQHANRVGPLWAPFPVPLAGRHYAAMRVSGEELGANDPFKLLADRVPGAREAMGLHTLIVAGATFPDGPGFFLLERRVHPEQGDGGHGTELLDRQCAVAAEGS